MSALKCSDIVNEIEMNNICIVPTRCLLSLAEAKGVGGGRERVSNITGSSCRPLTAQSLQIIALC